MFAADRRLLPPHIALGGGKGSRRLISLRPKSPLRKSLLRNNGPGSRQLDLRSLSRNPKRCQQTADEHTDDDDSAIRVKNTKIRVSIFLGAKM